MAELGYSLTKKELSLPKTKEKLEQLDSVKEKIKTFLQNSSSFTIIKSVRSEF